MDREKLDRLVSYCQNEVGENLRVVTFYGPNAHEPLYTRSDVPEELQLDTETREMFRSPLVQMQKAAQQMADVHPTLGDPVVATYAYENVSVVQVPLTRDSGIIVSIDAEAQLPDGFGFQCKSILSET